METNLRSVVTVTPKVTKSLLAPHRDTFVLNDNQEILNHANTRISSDPQCDTNHVRTNKIFHFATNAYPYFYAIPLKRAFKNCCNVKLQQALSEIYIKTAKK